MLRQAAAVLVTLAAFIAAHLDAVALLGVLDERLAVTGTAHARLGGPFQFIIPRCLVRFVVNGTFLDVGNRLVDGQAGGWGGEAPDLGFGRGVSSNGAQDGHGSRLLAASNGSSEGSEVGAGIGDRLASGDAVGGVEGPGEERVGICSGVGLSAGDTGRGGAGERGTLVHQWP